MGSRTGRSALTVAITLVVLSTSVTLVNPVEATVDNGVAVAPAPLPLPTGGAVRPAASPSAPRPDYLDVPRGSSFEQAAAWFSSEGIDPGRLFRRSSTVTRRQMALFLWRMMGRPEGRSSCGYRDVPNSFAVHREFATAACFLKDADVVNGYNNDPGRFAPFVTIDRGQMAAALWRLADKPASTLSCGIVDLPSSADARRGICWLKAWGIATGYGGDPTRFAPRVTATREHMATHMFGVAGIGEAWKDGVTARGSVEQLSVQGAPGTRVSVYDADGSLVDSSTLDADGGKLWRAVAPGDYRIVYAGSDRNHLTRVKVRPEDLQGLEHPHPSGPLYTGQTLKKGFNYLTTRDGTRLGALVTLPAGPGPYPTLVEYSGYDLSNPFEVTAGSSPFRLLAPEFGYALVQVQMRGTGCSGGAFDYFEPLQSLDGYDAIETVAAQSWVKANAVTGKKVVGTVGISYPGISQLFVAQTQPPSLGAITPVSVIADTARAVLFPGGIYNNGFALSWASGRVNEARPARPGAVDRPWVGGQTWVGQKITARNANGAPIPGYVPDDVCRLNQRLHGQAVDLLNRIENSKNETPGDYYLSPTRFADRITAPTLMVGAWQDEQTGGFWPNMLHQFPETTFVRMIAQNGTHIEPIGPDNLKATFEHLAFFVKGQRPAMNTVLLNFLVSIAVNQLFGGQTPPPGGELSFTASEYDNTTKYPTYASAEAAYRAAPRAIIRLENGAGPAGQAGGSLIPSESVAFKRWPLAGDETTPLTWYFLADGVLSLTPPTALDGRESRMTYTYDPANGPTTNWRGGAGCSEWSPEPTANNGASCFDWKEPAREKQAALLGDAFTGDTLLAGTGLADLWLTWNPTGTPEFTDTDVEVTISEVRPDGREIYVQSGWARTSFCVEDPELSQPGVPWFTGTAEDAATCALTPGEATRVTVPIFPYAHIFRAGSKLRVTIDAPGGTRVLWKFDTRPDPASHTIHMSASMPSSITLNQVTNVLVDTYTTGVAPPVATRWQSRPWTAARLQTAPKCSVLRGQPCRTYPGALPVNRDGSTG
jgi:uncharacterized protein